MRAQPPANGVHDGSGSGSAPHTMLCRAWTLQVAGAAQAPGACSDGSAHAAGAAGCCVSVQAAAAASEAARLHRRVACEGGLVLGYLSFDGEGTRTDVQEAVRFFKLASQAGCKEAQHCLGWMYNTGQFG